MTADILSKPVPRDAGSARVAVANQAPSATAPFDEREAWCQGRAQWFITQMPEEEPPPPDVRPTQHFENEFNSCKLDPPEYERQTRAK